MMNWNMSRTHSRIGSEVKGIHDTLVQEIESSLYVATRSSAQLPCNILMSTISSNHCVPSIPLLQGPLA